jgi:hypothetical protein
MASPYLKNWFPEIRNPDPEFAYHDQWRRVLIGSSQKLEPPKGTPKDARLHTGIWELFEKGDMQQHA